MGTAGPRLNVAMGLRRPGTGQGLTLTPSSPFPVHRRY